MIVKSFLKKREEGSAGVRGRPFTNFRVERGIVAIDDKLIEKIVINARTQEMRGVERQKRFQQSQFTRLSRSVATKVDERTTDMVQTRGKGIAIQTI